MQALIDFLTDIYSIELIDIGLNTITMGQTIGGFLIIGLAISIFKKIKI